MNGTAQRSSDAVRGRLPNESSELSEPSESSECSESKGAA
jgi:hypothetical protein